MGQLKRITTTSNTEAAMEQMRDYLKNALSNHFLISHKVIVRYCKYYGKFNGISQYFQTRSNK